MELTCTSSKVLYSSFLWHQTLFLVGGGTDTGHLLRTSAIVVFIRLEVISTPLSFLADLRSDWRLQ